MRSTIRRYLQRRLGVPTIPLALERLASAGFSPDLVFDVGAYRGDFALDCLRQWPAAELACFEPQRSAIAKLESAVGPTTDRLRVFHTLLGARSATHVVLHEAETASSVLPETAGPRHTPVRHPMTTIDRVVATEFAGRAPDLLKIDVQGYELEVLKGAEDTLPSIQAVLTEIDLLDLHDGVPLLAEVVGWLAGRGFVAYDLCGATRRPLDGALWQVDMVFVPERSRLRGDKRWQG